MFIFRTMYLLLVASLILAPMPAQTGIISWVKMPFTCAKAEWNDLGIKWFNAKVKMNPYKKPFVELNLKETDQAPALNLSTIPNGDLQLTVDNQTITLIALLNGYMDAIQNNQDVNVYEDTLELFSHALSQIPYPEMVTHTNSSADAYRGIAQNAVATLKGSNRNIRTCRRQYKDLADRLSSVSKYAHQNTEKVAQESQNVLMTLTLIAIIMGVYTYPTIKRKFAQFKNWRKSKTPQAQTV